jgi:hypothetical protein
MKKLAVEIYKLVAPKMGMSVEGMTFAEILNQQLCKDILLTIKKNSKRRKFARAAKYAGKEFVKGLATAGMNTRYEL